MASHSSSEYMREYRRKNLKRLKAKERAYRATHKEKISAAYKKWRAANKDRVKEKAKRYREENKEKIRTHHRKLYLKNRKKYVAAAAKRYAMNRVKINKANRAKHQADPRIIMLRNAKTRARAKNITFCLALEDIVIPEHCPILQIPLLVGAAGRHAGSPSIDRMDSKGPYNVANCRVISFKANTLKNDGTIEDHERVIAYMKGEL